MWRCQYGYIFVSRGKEKKNLLQFLSWWFFSHTSDPFGFGAWQLWYQSLGYESVGFEIGIDFDISKSIMGLMNPLFGTFVEASTCYRVLLILIPHIILFLVPY